MLAGPKKWAQTRQQVRRERRAEGLCADCGRLSGESYHCRRCALRVAAQAQRERDRRKQAA